MWSSLSPTRISDNAVQGLLDTAQKTTTQKLSRATITAAFAFSVTLGEIHRREATRWLQEKQITR